MTYNISITFDDEREAALAEMLDSYNASAGSSLTAAEYFAQILIGSLEAKVKERYDRALRELGESAATLDYASRQALLAQVAAAIAG